MGRAGRAELAGLADRGDGLWAEGELLLFPLPLPPVESLSAHKEAAEINKVVASPMTIGFIASLLNWFETRRISMDD